MSDKAGQSVCWTVTYPRQAHHSILGKQETATSLIFFSLFIPQKKIPLGKSYIETEEIFTQVPSRIIHCHKQSCWVNKGKAGIKL